MKKAAMFALVVLFLAACSSSNSLKVEQRTFECGEGLIELDLVGSSQPVMMFNNGREVPQQISFQFMVSNNSDETVTVKRIQVYQKGSSPIQLESAQGGFDTEIAPGHDHTFTVNGTARQLRAARQGDENFIAIRGDVSLTNGDSYACTFSIPIGLAVQ